MQDELLRAQIRHSIAPFSPFWRHRFTELGRKPTSFRSTSDLATLPPMGERDVSPTGDPARMASLVLQAGESGYALDAPGPEVRRAKGARLTNRDAYQRLVEADTRAISFVFSGLGFTYPIASARADLDLIARAGARLWQVLGLSRNDVLLSALQPGATTEHVALQYAAMAAGAPALFPGSDPADLMAAIRLAPPTVLAAPTSVAPQILAALSDLSSLRTLLLVGAPTDAERVAAAHGLSRAGAASDTAILAVHAPAGARVLWGECRASGGTTGLHTYPDLDIVQVIDADSGDPSPAGGELVLTQLGMRGSALLRWRTGDVVTAVTQGACPACGRGVPRILGMRRGALVTQLDTGRSLDLRSIAGVLSGRRDVRDWRVVVARRQRDGVLSATVHYEAINPDDASIVIGIAGDIRQVTGSLPTQLIAADRVELAHLVGSQLSPRILVG